MRRFSLIPCRLTILLYPSPSLYSGYQGFCFECGEISVDACFFLTFQVPPMVSHLWSIKRVARLYWMWSKGLQEADLCQCVLPVIGQLLDKVVGLQYRSTGQPLLCVCRLYGCSRLSSEFVSPQGC